MSRNSTPKNTEPPVSMMVWTIHDPLIEDHALLEAQFEELRQAGFSGVAVFVRCSRYSWDDAPAQSALSRVSALCQRAGLQLWLGPDPRFISRPLITQGGGVELLLFGDSTRADIVPNTAPVLDGRFSLRCELRPRHAHTVNEVALEYTPLGLLRCYAIRSSPGSLGGRDALDITDRSLFFYNARDRYVEAFGRFTPPDGSQWKIVAFFHVASSHVDYSNPRQMNAYAARLTRLRNAPVVAQALMWDEAGYTCTYGSLPFTKAIRSAFRRTTGYPLEKFLWKLAFDAADGSHIPLRVHYYRTVQKSVNDAQRRTNAHVRRLWGPGTLASIHDTWHFESADMCDMNHGSLDLWRGCRVKSGGFVDLGAVNQLRHPQDPYYANLAAMSVIGASLGRHSSRRFAVNNLWTVGDDAGEGWQTSVMDHCVNVMALFGIRWLAHAYGPVGTVGEENTFLGSPPLPGYPDHSTWKGFPEWNERLRRHCAATAGRLPLVNVLLAFPVEALYALGDRRADDIASSIFRLILALVDAQFQIEVVSTEEATRGKWNGERFHLGRTIYEAVIYPYARVLDRPGDGLRGEINKRTLLMGVAPERTVDNRKIKQRLPSPATDSADVIRQLERLNVTRAVLGPGGTWVSATRIREGLIATIVPSRHGATYEGTVTAEGASLTLPRCATLTRVLFPEGAAPSIVP